MAKIVAHHFSEKSLCACSCSIVLLLSMLDDLFDCPNILILFVFRLSEQVFLRLTIFTLVVVLTIVESQLIFSESLGDVAAGKMIVFGGKHITRNVISYQGFVNISTICKTVFEDLSPSYYKCLSFWHLRCRKVQSILQASRLLYVFSLRYFAILRDNDIEAVRKGLWADWLECFSAHNDAIFVRTGCCNLFEHLQVRGQFPW